MYGTTAKVENNNGYIFNIAIANLNIYEGSKKSNFGWMRAFTIQYFWTMYYMAAIIMINYMVNIMAWLWWFSSLAWGIMPWLWHHYDGICHSRKSTLEVAWTMWHTSEALCDVSWQLVMSAVRIFSASANKLSSQGKMHVQFETRSHDSQRISDVPMMGTASAIHI